MLDKLLITKNTSLEEIKHAIGKLREQKGKEKETLKLIDESLSFGNYFVANLFFEEALTYQHLYMNDNADNKAISNMEKTILKASLYVNKYKIEIPTKFAKDPETKKPILYSTDKYISELFKKHHKNSATYQPTHKICNITRNTRELSGSLGQTASGG